jgi:hypothetical protein
MTAVRTASGARKELPATLDPERVVGLDLDGRIVVKVTDDAPFLFGLTLCCNAFDKGVEGGVVCRACYGDSDIGHYLYPDDTGSFPDLDPIVGLDINVP